MNNNTLPTVIVSAVVAALIAFGTLAFVDHSAVVPAPVSKPGALAGPIIPSPFLQWGGINRWGAVQAMVNTASTTCSIQSPAATSTLKGFTVDFTTLPSYATLYELGASATQYATTTAIVALYTTGPSNYQFAATTTNTAIAPDGIVPPNTWVNLMLSTSTAVADGVQGQCTATFDQILN